MTTKETKEQSMQHQTYRKLPLLAAAVVLGAFIALFGLLGSAQATANVTGSIQQDANPASDGERGERFYGLLTVEPP